MEGFSMEKAQKSIANLKKCLDNCGLDNCVTEKRLEKVYKKSKRAKAYLSECIMLFEEKNISGLKESEKIGDEMRNIVIEIADIFTKVAKKGLGYELVKTIYEYAKYPLCLFYYRPSKEVKSELFLLMISESEYHKKIEEKISDYRKFERNHSDKPFYFSESVVSEAMELAIFGLKSLEYEHYMDVEEKIPFFFWIRSV